MEDVYRRTAKWRTFVSTIFKKEARNKAENHRPISLMSIVCYLRESFVKDSILTHMRATKKIRGISIKNQREKSRDLCRAVTSWLD